ncbi:hypothetical protein ABE288_07870 [Bacillus salipaludis]|uniref:hypothetical protein n=1 Tax=Bacillus salipaludis TaxID=2547811 RepID=UPI003D20E7C5
MGTRITIELVKKTADEAVVGFIPYIRAMKIPLRRAPLMALYFNILASAHIILL